MSRVPKSGDARGAKRRRAKGLRAHQRANAVHVLEHQRFVGLGATITIVGLALVGTHESGFGALIVVVGLLILLWAVHRFGRLGTERVAR